MDISKEDKVIIRRLVSLYFEVNPNMNKGIAFKTKAWDIISSYYIKYKKTEEEIKHCIESSPMNTEPIWNAFHTYFFKIKPKSEYKDSINKSLNPDDWL
jgi:hypothetical protein